MRNIKLHILIFFGFLMNGQLLTASEIDSLLSLIENQKLDTNRVQQLNKLSRLHWNSNPQQAEEYARQALEVSRSLNYKVGEAKAHYLISISFWTRGIYELAIEHCHESLKISEDIDNEPEIFRTKNLLSLIYHRQERLDEALKLLLPELNYWKLKKDTAALINVSNTIGTIYLGLRDFDTALEYFMETKNYLIEHASTEGYLSTVYYNIGYVYFELMKYEESVNHYKKAKSIAQKRQYKRDLVYIMFGMAQSYLELKDIELAMSHIDFSMKYAFERGDIQKLTEIYGLLSEIEYRNGNYQKALSHYENKMIYADSVFNENHMTQINSIEALYEIEKKENEISKQLRAKEILEKDKAIQETKLYVTLIGIGCVLSVGLLISFGIWQRARKNRILQNARNQISKSELETIKFNEQELTRALEFRKNDLDLVTDKFILKGEIVEGLKNRIEEIKKIADGTVEKDLNGFIKTLDQNKILDRDWEEFKMYFEQVHNGFFEKLLTNYPQLSPSELKLCALTRLNLNIKETANVLAISPESVKTSRHRLRKKLQLNTEDSLSNFLIAC